MLADLPANSVDLIFADPPFNWDVAYGEWDDSMPGLGIRLRETKHGLTKSFRIQYRVGAQQRAKHLDARKVKLETRVRLPASFLLKPSLESISQRRKPKRRPPLN